MKFRKSIFLKAAVFLFSTLCVFYACFVAVSNITATNNFFEYSGSFHEYFLPENPSDNFFNPNYESFDLIRPTESPGQELAPFAQEMEQEISSVDLTDSELTNHEFAQSPQGSLVWVVICLFMVLSGFVYHCLSLGWQKGSDQLQLSIIKKWPIDLLLLPLFILIAILISIGYIFSETLVQYNLSSFPRIQIYLSVIFTTCFVTLYAYLLLIVAQIKAGTIIKSSFVYRVIQFFTKLIKGFISLIVKIYHLIPLVWREILILLAFIIGDGILISLLNVSSSYWLVTIFIVYNLAFIFISLNFTNNYRKVRNAILALAKGQLDHYLDVNKMSPDFHDLAHAINNLNQGINLAIEEKTKSELFKTELITNVSHDIKTPLTSIIAYTDLLQRENIDNQQAEEYIQVLSKQANRLKNLIEDLIEASKISTGNINVELIPLDLKQMLEQAYAEYLDKFEQRKLRFILTFPEDPCIVQADGKCLWRVLDNLLSNVVKYAQDNTRVYLDVICDQSEMVKIRIRNVSAEPLNITADQLFERFIQGDSSRSQEGSGIGLSIAQSLITAQKGSMEIQIDGDLFTVEMKLLRYIIQY